MIILTAKLTAKPGFEKTVEDALLAMIPNVQNEENALQYALHRVVNKPSTFLYYEQYADKKAFETHGNTVYFKELVAALDGKLVSAPEETFYDLIGSIDR